MTEESGLRNLAAEGVPSERVHFVGNTMIDSLRAFGATSLTFVVTINQKITSTSGTNQQSQQYAVTVASNGGGSWQVNNIELASAGNT